MATQPDPPPIPVYRFVGHSGSGKTTLLEKLVAALTARRLRVAIAKDTHHTVELDHPGKDSWRLAKAGASQVVLTSPGQLALFQRQPARPALHEVAALVAPSADLLLAEGFRDDADYPAVIVWRSALSQDLPRLNGPICAVVSDAQIDLEAPSFPFEDIPGLLRHLVPNL